MNSKQLSLQVLIAAMNQTDFSLIRNMNINADCIMANQTNNTAGGDFEIQNHNVSVINSTLVGIGVNRNLALEKASADIVLFADDDMVYADNMAEGVLDAFTQNPKADIIIFSCTETDSSGNVVMEYSHKKSRRLFANSLRYPTYVIAARRKKLKRKKVRFSSMFGAGSAYAFGEDTVFLADCFKKRLRVYSSDFNIGTSTKDLKWFEGYNDNFFFNKGAIYECIFGKLAPIVSIYYAKKYSKITGIPFKSIYKKIEEGTDDYKHKIKSNNMQSNGM